MARPLTEKQRRFVEFYMGAAIGNALKAARMAGYKGNQNTLGSVATENLQKPAIKAAIAARRGHQSKVMGREERQSVMTSLARDLSLTPRDRLKAIELLSRCHGDFIERKEVHAVVQSLDELPTAKLLELLGNSEPKLLEAALDDDDEPDPDADT